MPPNETTPLQDGSTSGSKQQLPNSARRPNGEIWKDRIITGSIVVAVMMGALFLIWPTATNTTSTATPRLTPGQKPEDVSSVPAYRPVCKIYTKKGVSIVQTSLGKPSQQWSPVECTREPGVKQSWFSHLFSPPPVERGDVNSYGAPDAMLRMGAMAHTDRLVPILGFGGAFTEASALNYKSLSQKGQDAVMALLFGKDGLGYSLGRVHMNSCDFSVKSYSFDDTDGDFDLKHFDTGLHHDVSTGMVDMMLRATSVFREAWGSDVDGQDGNLRIYTSPWSPPSWMKAPTPDDNKNASHAKTMSNSAQPTCLRDGVGPDSKYAKAWALYFSKFITAYENLGIRLFAVTIQNEPEFPAPWEACSFTPKTEGRFLANHLGPQLKKTHPDVKIFIFDHNKDHAPKWIKHLVNASNPASEFVSGTAIHWYAGGMDRLLDGAVGIPNMHRVLEDLGDLGVKPNHVILGSEACHCPSTGYAGGDINVAWARAERYAHTILADLAAGSNGWVDWNLILDSVGGPNHLTNLCDTSLLAVPHRAEGVGDSIPPLLDFEHTGKRFGRVVGDDRTREELNALGFSAKYLDLGVVVQPMYYYMGHISRHVRPGSRAFKALVDSSSEGQVFRPDGQVVAGGGINDLARDGIELTLWPCEGSTRQQFLWDETTKQLKVFGHDWKDKPTTSCIAKKPDANFKALILTSCNETLAKAGRFEMAPLPNGTSTNIVMTNGKRSSKKTCLVVQELKNDGGAYGPRGGAQVTFGYCNSTRAEWTFDKETGEISSLHFGDKVCMTTGWPFLQMGAFETPNNPDADQVVVILNEAAETANYALSDEKQEGWVLLTGHIPPHSIQTVSLSYTLK